MTKSTSTANKKSTRAAKPSNKVLADRTNKLEAELKAASAALEHAKDENRRLRKYKVAVARKSAKKSGQALIPRPRGEKGKDWNLQHEMRLDDNKVFYNEIMLDVRRSMDKAGLDYRKPIRHQAHGRLQQAIDDAKEKHPYLARFENDWATYEFIKQALANRRKWAVKQAGEKAAAGGIDPALARPGDQPSDEEMTFADNIHDDEDDEDRHLYEDRHWFGSQSEGDEDMEDGNDIDDAMDGDGAEDDEGDGNDEDGHDGDGDDDGDEGEDDY